MKLMIGVLLIGLLVSVSAGVYQPSFSSLSGVDSATLVDAMDDAILLCEKVIDGICAGYHDFMASNRIVSFFESSLPPGQKPGTILLLGCGLAGLWRYGRGRRSGSR